MTAADLTMVAAERAQARNRATVSRAHSRWRRRGHDERGRAHYNRSASDRSAKSCHAVAYAVTMTAAPSLWPRRRHDDRGARHDDRGAVTMTAAPSRWPRRRHDDRGAVTM